MVRGMSVLAAGQFLALGANRQALGAAFKGERSDATLLLAATIARLYQEGTDDDQLFWWALHPGNERYRVGYFDGTEENDRRVAHRALTAARETIRSLERRLLTRFLAGIWEGSGVFSMGRLGTGLFSSVCAGTSCWCQSQPKGYMTLDDAIAAGERVVQR